jgi:hypothetical protein
MYVQSSIYKGLQFEVLSHDTYEDNVLEQFGVYTTPKKRPYEVLIDSREQSSGYCVDFQKMVEDYRTRMSGLDAHYRALNDVLYLKAYMNGDVEHNYVSARFEDPLGNQFESSDFLDYEWFDYNHWKKEGSEYKWVRAKSEMPDLTKLFDDALYNAIEWARERKNYHLLVWYKNKLDSDFWRYMR